MRLHFQSHGHGPPIIVLHGLFGSSDNWLPFARKLSNEFQLIAVDQRNHGRSPHSDHVDYHLMAADLAELMDAQNLPRGHILGNSMGGKTAMQFALSHPSRVEKLIIADMAPHAYPPLHAKIYDALLALDLRNYQNRSQVSDALAPEIPNEALRLFLLKMVGRNPDGSLFWQTNIRALHANSELLRAALPDAAPFTGPALFIRGEKSDYLLDADLPGIRRLFPMSNIRTIANAAHWLHVEAPEPFQKTVREFLLS